MRAMPQSSRPGRRAIDGNQAVSDEKPFRLRLICVNVRKGRGGLLKNNDVARANHGGFESSPT